MENEPSRKNLPIPLYVVSGGVGASGEQLARTVLAQFEQGEVEIRVCPKVLTPEQLSRVFNRAAEDRAVILHSFVDQDLHRMALDKAAELKIEAVDLVGPLVRILSRRLEEEPLGKPGLYRHLYRSYFDRIGAMDYTLAHDDGKDPGGWDQAEIVLTGPSRVGKTPVSLYLSVLGWKVANIPLVSGIPVPEELFLVDPRRVVGLTISPGELVDHRRHRQRRLGVKTGSDYIDPIKVFEEIDRIEKILKRRGIQVIDVTDKPIETIADEIMRLVIRKTEQ